MVPQKRKMKDGEIKPNPSDEGHLSNPDNKPCLLFIYRSKQNPLLLPQHLFTLHYLLHWSGV